MEDLKEIQLVATRNGRIIAYWNLGDKQWDLDTPEGRSKLALDILFELAESEE